TLALTRTPALLLRGTEGEPVADARRTPAMDAFASGVVTRVQDAQTGPLAQAADVARHLVLPAVALALPIAAMIERLQSGAIAATLGERFVAAAVARGVPPGRLLWRNALKPSLRPVAAVFGVVFGNLLSGSFIVEIVASWPGLGRLMFDALRSRDLYLVAGCAAAGGAFLALGAILSDLALAAIDPRLRGREEAGA
ncbi:MAG TPA: ABC transporter permease, partial [Vicinamibacterales bacterium]|nr:ABC transporter permease [Vicinamibacterales bacterium]